MLGYEEVGVCNNDIAEFNGRAKEYCVMKNILKIALGVVMALSIAGCAVGVGAGGVATGHSVGFNDAIGVGAGALFEGTEVGPGVISFVGDVGVATGHSVGDVGVATGHSVGFFVGSVMHMFVGA